MANSILAIIPAKATSSRIPSKNLRPLGGIPLCLWTVRAALDAKPKMEVWVSTDVGEAGGEIAHLALKAGALSIRRPPELCRDPAQMPDVALHALGEYRDDCGWLPDTVCVLLPTSPFRTGQHITEALALHLSDPNRRNVVSVTDFSGAARHKLCLLSQTGAIRGGPPLRDPIYYGLERVAPIAFEPCSPVVLINGAVWITTPDRLLRDRHISAIGALPYVMDEESGLDIDSPLDFDVAEMIVRRREWEDRRPFGHNEVAAVCREELKSVGIDPNGNDWLIYHFAAAYNGERCPGAVRQAFAAYRQRRYA